MIFREETKPLPFSYSPPVDISPLLTVLFMCVFTAPLLSLLLYVLIYPLIPLIRINKGVYSSYEQ